MSATVKSCIKQAKTKINNTMKTEIKFNEHLIGYATKIDSSFTKIECTDNRQYIRSDKTELCYNSDTPKEVIQIIDNYFPHKERLIFDYGDIKTGKSWNEVYDIMGTIGRSTGAIKIPLLIHNSRSIGGGGLLTNCIIKISLSKGKRVLYQHKNYHSTVNDRIESIFKSNRTV